MQTSKLGKCEVCDKDDAKYCCPECEVKTCSMPCVNIHKKELKCDGIRSRVQYKPIKKFSNMDFLNDYRFLEEAGRNAETYSNNKKVHSYSFYELPLSLVRLRGAALRRGVELQFLPKNFSRHKENTSYLDYKKQELFWRIEWIFPQANDTKYADNRVIDTELLGNVLHKFIDSSTNSDKTLKYYHSAGHSGILILLKAEKVRGKRYFELDPLVSLRDNLSDKIIIEFPLMTVIMKEHKQCYDIITPDEEEEIINGFIAERQQKQSNKQWNTGKRKHKAPYLPQRKEEFRNNFFMAADNSDADSNTDQDDELLANKFHKVLKTEDDSTNHTTL